MPSTSSPHTHASYRLANSTWVIWWIVFFWKFCFGVHHLHALACIWHTLVHPLWSSIYAPTLIVSFDLIVRFRSSCDPTCPLLFPTWILAYKRSAQPHFLGKPKHDPFSSFHSSFSLSARRISEALLPPFSHPFEKAVSILCPFGS